jgi:serine/threonine-protein kinase
MEETQNVDRPIRVIGRYALYGKLAAGGMAAVHFGRLLGPAGFSRTVAIKRLHAQYAKDPEFVAMFLDEARLAARIQHPNVVATVDVVSMEDELFLVMDYVRGESFSRLLRASRKKGIDVPIGIVGGVAAGMLHGLHAAHEAKDEQGRPLAVVHRDVSPQNVLVGVDGVPRVLDFGVAKAAARIQVTRDGQMKGKLAYMAPEQLQAKGVDRRTDIFAAGIVIWEALTGRRLFDAEEASEVLRMILSEDIPPPSAVIPSIPRNVDAVVMKALIRDPKARYQTAREFAIALEDAMNLSSAREIGEWVERVAGDTLLHREQALAEIEAVSDISLLTDSAAGFLKTLDGVSSESKVPDEVSQWDEGPTKIFDPARGTEEEATRMDNPAARRASPDGGVQAERTEGSRPAVRVDAASQPRIRRGPPTTRLGLGSAKPATARAASPAPAKPPADQRGQSPQKARASSRPSAPPRPSGPRASVAPPPRPAEPRMFPPPSEPPPPPAPPPAQPSAAFDDENETTHVFDKDRHVLGGAPEGGAAAGQLFGEDDEATSVFDKDKHKSDDTDENETTHVFDSDRHGPKRVPVRAGGTKIGLGVPKAPAVPSDRPAPAKTSPVSSNRPAAALKTPPPIPPPAPAEKPGLKTIRVERRSDKPKAAPAQTVIVQEHTDPAIFRHSDSIFSKAAHWIWDDPAKRGFRVGLPAGFIVFFAVLFASSGHGGRTLKASPKAAATELSDESRDTAPKAVAREEPRGIDPSTLPPADDETEPAQNDTADKKTKRRSASRAATPPAEARVAAVEPSPSPPSPPKPAAEEPPPAPPPPQPKATDDIESPYAKSEKPSAPAPAAQKPASKAKKSGGGDCSNPFTVDENGIKRIRPECL